MEILEEGQQVRRLIEELHRNSYYCDGSNPEALQEFLALLGQFACSVYMMANEVDQCEFDISHGNTKDRFFYHYCDVCHVSRFPNSNGGKLVRIESVKVNYTCQNCLEKKDEEKKNL